METMDYKWQGDPVTVKIGFSKVCERPDKPLYWYNYECSLSKHCIGEKTALIPAIQVTQYGQTFVLANHFGIGHNKLIKGGWPNSTHFSMTDGQFTEDDSEEWQITEFDLSGFTAHEACREKWQAENFPEEYKKMQAIKAGFHKSKNLFNS